MKSYIKCNIEHPEKGILLIKRADSDEHGGMWESVGGGVEPGEELEQAVIREVKEETGLDVEVKMQGTLILSDDADSTKKYQANLFTATSVIGEVVISDPDEHSDFAWIKRTELFAFIAQGNEIERWTLTHLLA